MLFDCSFEEKMERMEFLEEEERERLALEELEENDVAVALLNDGTLTEYDFATKLWDVNDTYFRKNRGHTHLGIGVIHSVNGVMEEEDNETYSFFNINK